MICISISQESRRCALADMVNAKLFGDVLELRLDRFGKPPDLGEMIAARPKPIIMVCKRPEDGGYFEGTEVERLTMLRQCIISKADYVEIELDSADDIRPFPPSKRVISYTNLSETPNDILEIYEEMKGKRPDVIKLMTLARTPEEAWPLVQILAKAVVPTVVVGLGRPGIMLSLLSKKLGAPWIYAALERGLEAYPGQTTVEDLETIYRFKDIQKSTRLIGVTGLGEREQITVAALNAAFAHHDMSFRCLPMPVGNIKVFRKIMEAVKLAGVVVDADHQTEIMEINPEVHGLAKETQAADVLIYKNDAWHAMHNSGHAWVNAIKNCLKKRFPKDPFKDRFVLCAGLSVAARVIAREVQRQGGNAIIASSDKKRGLAFAQEAGCRYIALEAIYVTLHDVLVYCADESDEKLGRVGTIHAGYFKPGMIVADLTSGSRTSELLRDAESRGCEIVEPLDLMLEILELQAKTLTGKHTPREVLRDAIPLRLLEDQE